MKNDGFLIVFFTRAIRVCVTALDVRYPRAENSSSRTCLAQIAAIRPHIRWAQIGLADDGRVEPANDSIAFKSVGFDYRVNVYTTVRAALLVPFTTLCATFLAVMAVSFATFRAVRTGCA